MTPKRSCAIYPRIHAAGNRRRPAGEKARSNAERQARHRANRLTMASRLALMEACLTIIQGRAGRPDMVEEDVYRVAPRNLWQVGDAAARIRVTLEAVPAGGEMLGFLRELPAAPDRLPQVKAAVASTLLARLELARDGELRVQQRGHWGAIRVSRLDTIVSPLDEFGSVPAAET